MCLTVKSIKCKFTKIGLDCFLLPLAKMSIFSVKYFCIFWMKLFPSKIALAKWSSGIVSALGVLGRDSESRQGIL
jgi:hypothetical protein